MAPYFIGKDIAINCFREVPNVENYSHFITQISNNVESIPSSLLEKVKPIYTTPFFAWYMSTYFGARKESFVVVKYNSEHVIYRNDKQIIFEFLGSEKLEPNFMILFKNDTGDELYAANCKFNKDVSSIKGLQHYLSSKVLAKLHFDGTYMNCPPLLPSNVIINNVVSAIKAHKKRIIYISANLLGNETILSAIAKAVNKKIHVSSDKYGILKQLGLGHFFTLDPSTTYIRTIDYGQISFKKISRRNKLLGPSLTIVLSLRIYLSERNRLREFEKNNIYLFPYTSHNTPFELRIMKKIKTREYRLTNLMNTWHNNCKSDFSNGAELTSQGYDKVKFKQFSKHQININYLNLPSELTKSRSNFLMSWDEYLAWRRQNPYVTNNLE